MSHLNFHKSKKHSSTKTIFVKEFNNNTRKNLKFSLFDASVANRNINSTEFKLYTFSTKTVILNDQN